MGDILHEQSNYLDLNNPLLAGINGGEINDDLLLASGIESSPERLELKFENINTDKDDLLLPQNDLRTLGLNKSEESLEKTPIDKEDPLTGKGNNLVEQVDPLTGDTSNEVAIQKRSGKKRDKAGNSLNKAYDLGVLHDDQKIQDFVGKSDKKDFYKFNVNEKTDVDIELRGLSGNADVYLLNNQGKVLNKSVKGGKKVEDIERTLNPGTYYVRVQPKGNANANYTLSLDGELPDMAGNSLNKAYDLGVLHDDQKIQDFVGKSDKKDFYKFNVNEKTDVDIELGGLSGNADVYLLNNQGKVLKKSVKGGKKVEDIEEPLEPGTYYVRVQSKGNANANYTLSLDGELPDMAGNSLNKAYDLGVLHDDQKIQDFVGKSDKKDFYKFNVNEKTDVDIELRGLSGNADLYLLDNQGKVLDKSTKGGKKVEGIEEPLEPGTYYVRVQSKGNANANYTLSLDGELPDMAGNSLNQAYDLGVLQDDQKIQDFVGKSDRKDFYKFNVNEKTDVEIELRDLSGNADLYLLDNQGKVLDKSTKGGKKVEGIEEPLEPGTYYVKVQSKNKRVNADYTLSLDVDFPNENLPYLLSTPLLDPEVQENNNSSFAFTTPVDLPSSFDLRDEGAVTSVKNQGNYGSCWAFATYASLESSIFKESGTKVDLSENHLKNHNGFEWRIPAGGSEKQPGEGGHHLMSMAYLSRGDGPVNEADDPYKDYKDHPGKKGNPEYYVGSMLIFNTDTEMKQGLIDYGALYTTMQINWSDFSKDKTTYYYSGGKSDGAHAVTIVGWDDDKAIPGATEEGAWLCKNSWGADWADDGYFWISYQDVEGANIGISFNDTTPASNFNNIYKHDDFGQVSTFSAPYALNAFTAEENEALSAIGFYTQADRANYNIKVYDDFSNGKPSNLLAETSGNKTYAGYHTVDLNSLVNLTKGDDFYIYLQIENGGNYPQAIDKESYNSPDSTARKGESYYSNDGKTWTDLTTWDSTANFSIKALTTELVKSDDSITVKSPNGGNTLKSGQNYNITWNDNISENVKLYLYKNNEFDRMITNSTPSDGSYDWKIPTNLASGSDYQIAIQSVLEDEVYDYSDNFFTIKASDFITFKSPNGGNTLESGQSYNITWNDNISENVKIYLYKDTEYDQMITESTASDGSYNWIIPTNLASGSDYQIVIQSVANGEIYDYSDNFFTIKASDFITVYSPNGGNTLESGKSYNITWNDNISENVKLYLYKNNQFDSMIANSTDSDGIYNWTVPTNLASGSDYQIAIQSVLEDEVYDYSDNFFTIKPGDSTSDKYYFTYSYNVGDSYNGFFYEKPGTHSLGDLLYRGSGFYKISDVESNVGNKNDIGDVYVYSYNDSNYTGVNYEPYYWSYGLAAGESGLGSEFDYIPSFFGYDYFDPYNEADG